MADARSLHSEEMDVTQCIILHQAVIEPWGTKMSWLNNLRIASKIAIIVVLLVLIAAGSIGFNAMSMKQAGGAYIDLVTRVDTATILNARGGRYAEGYLSSAYQLAAETT